ncbi:MAG TPA: hypothetical protein VGM06_08430 [Polyangiaceae bacterium]
MPGIPHARETDTEDVTWALQTAEALWKRNERVDALVWLRRAAQAAGETEHDNRALELAQGAAELAEWIAGSESPQSEMASSTRPIQEGYADEARITQTDEADDVSVDITIESEPSLPRDRMDTPTVPDEPVSSSDFVPPSSRAGPRPRAAARPPPLPVAYVQSAAEKHAGMLDPWADGDAKDAADLASRAPTKPPPAGPVFDVEEVVTSAPPIVRAPAESPPSAPSAARVVPNGVVEDVVGLVSSSKWPAATVDLVGVDALGDLPDDARQEFARAAQLHDLSLDEEVSGFALAVVLGGVVDLAATIVDTPAMRVEVGRAIRSRGTIGHTAPIRLVAASDEVRVATWGERAVEAAFRTCPWVEDDLRAAGDRLQALVGATMGPLGERMDPGLREEIANKLTLRVLAEHEVFAVRGKPIPGLLVVGAGELELVNDDGTSAGPVVRAGEFLFPSEVLMAGRAPSTVRAAKGGALILFADRLAAQELLVTCPPLLEIFAGM